ncbi:MAG: peptidylprolyl isomerase [Clostridia bacterium]|nr:peptidylprolyl isomerase [Clostridia bacterium]
MKKIISLLMCAVFVCLCFAGCGEKAQEETPELTGHTKVQVVMEDGGEFVIELYPEYAPETCANFIKLVNEGFYDGLTFHRIVDDFMAQGGSSDGKGYEGSDETIKGEFAANGFEQNTLSHTRGVISMARSQDFNSGSSQFFICYSGRYTSALDGQYAAFGKVVEGMEVVDGFTRCERTYNSMGELAVPVDPIVIKTMTVIK